MKSICFFSSYYTSPQIPYYVKYYLEELQRHFSEVIFLTNEKDFSDGDQKYLAAKMIPYRLYKNEGYDFGMWYKAFMEFDILNFDRIGLVNDSCILFGSLDGVMESINKMEKDYCGVLDSYQEGYHIQSYFVIINKPAIKYVSLYFVENGILKDINHAIKTYEIGMTEYLLKNNMQVSPVYHCSDCEIAINPSFFEIERLIKSGYPMIKKKIIFGNYRTRDINNLSAFNFNFSPRFYFQLIRNTSSKRIIDLDKLKQDYNYLFITFKLFFYMIYAKGYYTLRVLKRKFNAIKYS